MPYGNALLTWQFQTAAKIHAFVSWCVQCNKWMVFEVLVSSPLFLHSGTKWIYFFHFPSYHPLLYIFFRSESIYLNLDLKWHKISKNFQVYTTRYLILIQRGFPFSSYLLSQSAGHSFFAFWFKSDAFYISFLWK